MGYAERVAEASPGDNRRLFREPLWQWSPPHQRHHLQTFQSFSTHGELMRLLQKAVVPIAHHRLVARTSDYGANTLHRALKLFVTLVSHQDGDSNSTFQYIALPATLLQSAAHGPAISNTRNPLCGQLQRGQCQIQC